jgi:hypothetical protein
LIENPQVVAEERVARGVAYLDAEFPNWESYIDPDDLNMKSANLRVLAQLGVNDPRLRDVLDGDDMAYNEVMAYLRPGWRPWGRYEPSGTLAAQQWPRDHGFFTWLDGDDVGELCDGVEYKHLQKAWTDILSVRQAAFAVKPGSTPPAPSMTAEEDREFNDAYQERGIFADEPWMDPDDIAHEEDED